MRRPDSLAPLFTDVERIKGVGSQIAAHLKRLFRASTHAIYRDLVFHSPASVIDRRSQPPIPQAEEGQVATFEVTVGSHKAPPRGKRGIPYRVLCYNDTGSITLTFFHARGDFVKNQLPEGQTRIISGRVERYGNEKHMPHPDYIVPVDQKWRVARVEPVYPLTAGISNKQMIRLVSEALKALPSLPEWCDAAFVKARNWQDWKAAVTALHRPESLEALEHGDARARLAYDELLANQLALALARRSMKRQPGLTVQTGSELRAKMEIALPFTLTGGQKLVLDEMAVDMASGGRMLRLLQGDVGSGKTVVAMLAMADVIAMGKQAALMAPTDILARQHAALFTKMLEPLGVRVMLLTGKVGTPKEREAMRAEVAAGDVDIVIGTHALFQESVAFHDLALAVIDEQHRFGVEQRMQLAGKANIPPHILLMTATPIPRTLTMTVFGDMDSSILKEKPAGRQPIDTRALPLERLNDVVQRLHHTIAQGNKVYWI
ncbi:MAG: ATP-dependent DNA helicase RecG, partial [Rickettsiales bacterium]